ISSLLWADSGWSFGGGGGRGVLLRDQRIELAGDRLERVAHLGDPGELRELGHLGQHLAVIHRVERILHLHLRRHQLEEIPLVERSKAGFLGCGVGRRGRAGYGRYGHFILIVSSMSCLAVCSASTMFWY